MEAAIFDMDGVIVDDMGYHEEAWSLFLKDHGIALSSEEMEKRIHGKVNKEIMTDIFNGQLSDDEIEEFAQKKGKIFRDILLPHLKPVDGLIEYLDSLKRRGIKIALGTSAHPENKDFIIDGLDIRDYFDVIIDSSHVRKGKPDPEVFLKAALKLGVQPKDCVVFEDSLAGVEAAKNAGMKVVGLLTTHKELDADICIIDFKEKKLESL